MKDLAPSQLDADEHLILAAQQQNQAAFEQLMRKYSAPVVACVRSKVRDPHLAEDAIQTAWLKAWKELTRFKEGNFRAWLVRIASNEAINVLRSKKMSDIEEPASIPDRNPGATDEAERLHDRKEHLSAMHQCLGALGAEFRDVIVLADLELLKAAEIAKRLNIAPNTVYSRKSRAFKELRDCMERKGVQ
jgi:RNA polymerase sigma-70 factor (ECF subfamily)